MPLWRGRATPQKLLPNFSILSYQNMWGKLEVRRLVFPVESKGAEFLFAY